MVSLSGPYRKTVVPWTSRASDAMGRPPAFAETILVEHEQSVFTNRIRIPTGFSQEHAGAAQTNRCDPMGPSINTQNDRSPHQ